MAKTTAIQETEAEKRQDWIRQLTRAAGHLDSEQLGGLVGIAIGMWVHHPEGAGGRGSQMPHRWQAWIDCQSGRVAHRTVDVSGSIVLDVVGEFPAPPMVRRAHGRPEGGSIRLVVDNTGGAR